MQPDPRSWRRVVVLGGPGAGKSRLALQLGAALDLPVIHLDQVHWEPGWRRPSDEAFRARVAVALSGERWISDGLYLIQADDLIVPRADVVVWVEQPPWLRLWRCLTRTVAHWRRPRPDRAADCPERLDLAFLHYVLTFDRWKPLIEQRLSAFPQAPRLRVVGDREAAALVRNLSGPRPPIA